jgi:penicillin-binding protein 1A
MVDRSLGRALADPTASVTTAEGIDGLPRTPSPSLRAEERLRDAFRIFPRRVTRSVGRLRRWQIALLVFAIFITSSVATVYFGPASLDATPPLQTVFLYDRDGRSLGQIRAEENRVVVPLSDIPKMVQDAFVAVEDARFWSHVGVDPLAIGRALVSNAQGRRQGASTITQQLAKNQRVGGKRTIWSKVAEAITAIRLERRYPKKAILEAYLNSIYLGSGAYGVEAASRVYFGHGVKRITLAEAALLAGVTAAPQAYSPRVNRKAARDRRDYALVRMWEQGRITAQQRDAALDEPIRLAKARRVPVRSPLFVDWVRSEIKNRFGDDVLYRGGLKVRTSLDLDIQRAAEAAVADILGRPGDPDAAVVALDVATGQVRAMVGGRSPRPGDFNLATRARRQAGSAFKPFVLATALDEGFSLNKSYRAPGSMRVRFGEQVWPVRNFDRRSHGWLSLRSATAGSVNTVFAQLIRDVGPDRVAELAHELGINSRLSAVPSLALGTSGVNALEMASAYATFANNGRYLSPTGISWVKDGRGDLIYGDRERRGKRAISGDVAADVREALRAVVTRGTGRTVGRRGVDVFGKTGTTEDHRDAWFVGFSRGYAIAVWVGHRSNEPMNRVHGIRVTGSSFPAQIFKRVLTALLNKYEFDKEADSSTSPSGARGTSGPSPGASESPTVQPSEEPTPSPGPSEEPPRPCFLICP